MAIRAPYNFVPVSARVHRVPEADRVSHDVPFRDAVYGHLEVELQAQTPLCVGGRHEAGDIIEPFETPDGRRAIPGTSIKGMLRNVMEIATFSKMQFVERRRRFAVRDLTSAGRSIYGKKMTIDLPAGHRGRPMYEAKARAGWLERTEDGDWIIKPCECARVEHADLLQYLRTAGKADAALRLKDCFLSQDGTRNHPRQSPEAGRLRLKYEAWGNTSLQIQFEPNSPGPVPMSNGQGYLRLRMASDLGTGTETGTLVMTGQGSPNKRLLASGQQKKGKHREFVFYKTGTQTMVVPEDVRRDFELNHSKTQGEQHGGQEKPNDEWAFWKDRMCAGERVPVFFHLDPTNRQVDSLGLTLMFRLAYDRSVGDAIDNTSIDHHPDPGSIRGLAGMAPVVDMADAVFGTVRSHASGGEALGGRVSVGLFRIGVDRGLTELHEGALSSPKPTYYPTYIDQSARTGNEYATFMDDDVELAGWKRYPVRRTPQQPEAGTAATTVRWKAVQPGSTFRGKIWVHNLRPFELGALLWSIDFGDRQDRWHALGLARPFGFGGVALRIVDIQLRGVDAARSGIDIGEARRAFSRHMKKHVADDWENTEQIVQLLAMADPDAEGSHPLTYMTLGDRPAQNQFVAAKNLEEWLPRYSRDAGTTDRDRFPRTGRREAWQRVLKSRGAQEGVRGQEVQPGDAVSAEASPAVPLDILEQRSQDDPNAQVQWLIGGKFDRAAFGAMSASERVEILTRYFPVAIRNLRGMAGGQGRVGDIELLDKQLQGLGNAKKRAKIQSRIDRARGAEATEEMRDFLRWLDEEAS